MAAERSAPEPSRGRAGRIARGIARVPAAAGLAVNACLHAHLAGSYDAVAADLSQGTLFRVEAGLASLAALLVLVVRRPAADAFAWLVAAGGLALLLVYRYVDVGTLGPVPNMYEPVWTDDKRLTVLSRAVTILATVFLLLAPARTRSRRGR